MDLESASFETHKTKIVPNDCLLECPQSYHGMHQNGSWANDEESLLLMKSESSKEVGANVWKTSTDFRMSL